MLEKTLKRLRMFEMGLEYVGVAWMAHVDARPALVVEVINRSKEADLLSSLVLGMAWPTKETLPHPLQMAIPCTSCTVVGTHSMKVLKPDMYDDMRNSTMVENFLFDLEQYYEALGIIDDGATIMVAYEACEMEEGSYNLMNVGTFQGRTLKALRFPQCGYRSLRRSAHQYFFKEKKTRIDEEDVSEPKKERNYKQDGKLGKASFANKGEEVPMEGSAQLGAIRYLSAMENDSFKEPQEGVAKRLGLKITRRSDTEIKIISAKPLRNIGRAWDIKTRVGGWQGELDFLIAPLNDYKIVIGLDFIDKAHATINLLKKTLDFPRIRREGRVNPRSQQGRYELEWERVSCTVKNTLKFVPKTCHKAPIARPRRRQACPHDSPTRPCDSPHVPTTFVHGIGVCSRKASYEPRMHVATHAHDSPMSRAGHTAHRHHQMYTNVTQTTHAHKQRCMVSRAYLSKVLFAYGRCLNTLNSLCLYVL
ncbi:uncharacterized protein E5676_scaffold587G00360 [Cucumis melo var. makuwa]|uniref:Uncharacterized protein n=1 Tax=Cucumis melo var. makuwa TaxID=1194695 RepID=A0A5D3E2B7_CUCMM|nr:uncharacterized protein E5676_scaffold587G00360 [Cucumis melo var. makuwa]